MTRKEKSKKKGGSFAYVDQYDYPLSPCYKPKGQPPIPKLGWHSGGSCINNKTVSQMGINDKPESNMPSPSEIAWDNRYNCPKSLKMNGGNNNFSVNELVQNNKNNRKNNNTTELVKNNRKNNNTTELVKNNTTELVNNENRNENLINKLKRLVNENSEKNSVFFVNANRNGTTYKITVFYKPRGNKKFEVTVLPVKNKNLENIKEQINESFNYNTINGVINRIKNFEMKSLSRRNNINNNNKKNFRVKFNLKNN